MGGEEGSLNVESYINALKEYNVSFQDESNFKQWVFEYSWKCTEEKGFSPLKNLDILKGFMEEIYERELYNAKKISENHSEDPLGCIYRIEELDFSQIPYLARKRINKNRDLERELLVEREYQETVLNILHQRGIEVEDEDELKRRIFEKAKIYSDKENLSINECEREEWLRVLNISKELPLKRASIEELLG